MARVGNGELVWAGGGAEGSRAELVGRLEQTLSRLA